MTKGQDKVAETPLTGLEPPHYENGKPLLIAGLRGHLNAASWQDIPAQWQRLAAYGKVPGQVGSAHYGLCFNMSDGIDYLSGAEVLGRRGPPGRVQQREHTGAKIRGLPSSRTCVEAVLHGRYHPARVVPEVRP